jgi:CrcB protein
METVAKIASIAVGGAAGAVLRHLINISPLAGWFGRFPFPTFLINVAGSFLVGFLLIMLTNRVSVSDNVRVAVIVGFLGAFTTFSTFEMEIYALVKERLFAMAFFYLVLSLTAGFVGLVAGIRIAEEI